MPKRNPLQRRASLPRLNALVEARVLSQDAWERACQIAGHTPREQAWLKFISRTILTLGVVFILVGIGFFSAYNWVEPHRFVVFGGIQVALLALVGFVYYWGIDALLGRLALLAASVLVGVLLVVISQEYQTGADDYQLFATWALLMLAWVLVGQWGPLWLFWLVVVNIALSLYGDQIVGSNCDAGIYLAAIVLNSAALAVWERGRSREIEWLQARWIPNLVGTAILVLATVVSIQWLTFDGYYDWQSESYQSSRYFALNLAPFVYLGVLGGVIYGYYLWKQDLYMLAVGGFSVIVMTAAVIFSWAADFDYDSEFGIMTLACLAGIAIIVETGVLATALVHLHRHWEDDE